MSEADTAMGSAVPAAGGAVAKRCRFLCKWLSCVFHVITGGSVLITLAYLIVCGSSRTLLVNPSSDKESIDFVWFYSGAVNAFSPTAGSADLYDSQALTETVRRVSAPFSARGPYCLMYPPYFFLLLAPFTNLPVVAAMNLWICIQVGLVTASIWWLAADCGLDRRFRLLAVMLVVGAFPSWINFRYGQTAALALTGLTIFWIQLRRRRYFLAGLGTALLMIKLQFLPLALVPGWVAGRWRFVAGVASSGLALAVAAVLAFGWQRVLAYPAALLAGEENGTAYGQFPLWMVGVRNAAVVLGGGDSPQVRVLSFALFLLAAVFALRLCSRFPACEGGQGPASFTVAAVVSMLVLLALNPHMYVYDLLLVAVPALIAWPQVARDADGHSGAGRLALALKLFLVLFPLVSWCWSLIPVATLALRQLFYFAYVAILSLLSYLYLVSSPRQARSAPED